MNHRFYTYITTNPSKRVLYIGMTNQLDQRIIEHYLNRGNPETFAGKYYCYCLIYWEDFQWVHDAIAREKELKGWTRKKKLNLIRKSNPNLNFLNKSIMPDWPPKNAQSRSAPRKKN
ncbi:MAG: GIY-YIG nuclease family protein [Flammeovirgaceae bacterium]|nr:MAG: GIY-YIG nuclease family protein [Flammeovirgaceae bacterium]